MPAYPGSSKATLLRENQQKFLWQAELVTAGSMSVAFELAKIPHTYYPYGLSFEVVFSGNPGAFEVDVVAANTDTAGNYIQIGSISTVNSTNVGRFDMPTNLWPRYVAAFMKSLGNTGVLVSLQVTR